MCWNDTRACQYRNEETESCQYLLHFPLKDGAPHVAKCTGIQTQHKTDFYKLPQVLVRIVFQVKELKHEDCNNNWIEA